METTQNTRTPPPTALVTTFNRPYFMVRHEEEVWEFKPPLRYLFMSDHLKLVEDFVETVSPLESCSSYRPLQAGSNLVGKKIFVMRHPDRGIGDLLFMTGVLNYIHQIATGTQHVYFYTLSDRGHVLFNHPTLANKMPYYGPVVVDSLRSYDYHWVVPSVTEFNSEDDQLNVYDALFRSVGLEPAEIDAKFKRPTISLDDKDEANVDSLFYFIYNDFKIDLRKTPYYVVSPFCYSNLRGFPYASWLRLIKELSDQRPVVVLGAMKFRLPHLDMSAADFYDNLTQLKGNNPIINMIGDNIPMRLGMSVIARARCVFCLDSGPLYIAQACRTPAISLWGGTHPAARIGYDREYMDMAIWNTKGCRHAPCFAYDRFPVNKCPRHEQQRVCEVLATMEISQILEYLEKVESQNPIKVSLK